MEGRTMNIQVTNNDLMQDVGASHNTAHKPYENGVNQIDISSLNESAIKLEISIEGKNALEQRERANIDDYIIHNVREPLNLPAYSGIFATDKAIETSVKNCSEEEKKFIYDIVRQNFLISNNSQYSERERQANISLGMKKAEYAAENFISQEHKQSFMSAMESIAKLASAGKADATGKMDYGTGRTSYIGSGSNIIYTSDPNDMMKRMDPKAYEKYQELSQGNTEQDSIASMKYMMNWYRDVVRKNPNMENQYEARQNNLVNHSLELDATFKGIKTDSKAAFLESLKAFQMQNPAFLTNVLNREIKVHFC